MKHQPHSLVVRYSLIITITWVWLIVSAGFSLATSEGQVSSAPDKAQADQEVKYNRLINESSPYLLQHATNPVDWYPWTAEAFKKAQDEDKPIFLSIGYSTCHWCHVMEHESFSDQEVAAILNEHFVSIKVDREERPDIDKVYMVVTQAMTGRGGWPMTVILTPDKKPFFAGTYFPKTSGLGRPGLMELLPKIVDVWKNERDAVNKNADQITDLLTRISGRKPGDAPGNQILVDARMRLTELYDPEFGGFGEAPKFPTPHILTFLLRQYHHSEDSRLLAMVENTLTQMRLGGIYDQVGFGFHRYATDARWLVPHFEKMLYDQALLAIAYLEAYQVTGERIFAQTAREIFTYALRDLRAAEGGFFSAEDADSEGVEGKFYLWTLLEIQNILDKDNAKLYSNILNVEKDGNFASHEPPTEGKNILHLKKTIAEISKGLQMSQADLEPRLELSRQKLFKERKKRIHPFKDDKILTAWNGLMIAALAKGGKVLKENRYTSAAEKAAVFILVNLRDENGRLLRRYRRGKAGIPAQLNDYAFMVWGLLELYENTYDPEYLIAAIDLNDQMLSLFWDDHNGGLFLTASDGEHILVRHKEVYDGALPSGNSVALLNLLRLSRITANKDYSAKAQKTIKAFSADVKGYPAGHAQFMVGLNFALHPNYEIVIVGQPNAGDTLKMLAALQNTYLPDSVVIFIPTDDQKATSEIIGLAPYTRTMKALNNRSTAYVCQDFVCKLPTNNVKQMLANLDGTAASSVTE
jgi:uncharacterized protein YyaL (SSP411 family)